MSTFIGGGASRAGNFLGQIWLLPIFFAFAFAAHGQVPTCAANATAPSVRAEGFAEQVGDVTIVCSGGVAGSPVSLTVFVTLNVNVTNRLDASGNPTGVSVTLNSGAGAVPVSAQQRIAGAVFSLSGPNYTVPLAPATPITLVISGLRAAAGLLPQASGPSLITASIVVVGAQSATTPPLPIAIASPTLFASSVNNGIPCFGSPLPDTADFAGFTAANEVSSSVRITEALPTGFAAKTQGTDTGTRIIVKLSGYSQGTRVFTPDAIVGSTGVTPTSAGGYNSTINPGSYNPISRQLLLARVNGADANGLGGVPLFQAPGAATTFSAVSEVSLAGGAGYAVYEVTDSNLALGESAQIPLFLVAPSVSCTGATAIPTIGAVLGPVSTINVASDVAPIPRFSGATPPTDCSQLGDCGAAYFPTLMVDATPISLSAASLGNRQGANRIAANGGGGVLGITTSVVYTSSATGWLTVTPSAAQVTSQNGANLQVSADPAQLQPGTYTADIKISATTNCGTSATTCSASIPVTFTVGPAGVTIQNVGNAASFQYGTVAPGSYAVLYGLSLAGTKVGVTFNQVPATIVFNSASQINLIVPSGLGNQIAADVVVTVDGRVSNSFKVNLALNAPGIFNPGIINFDDGAVNSASKPAKRGSFISIYLTGLSNPPSGQVTVNIGSQLNLIPSFAGAQPTLPALNQVNITVPSSLPATPNPVLVQICIPGPAGQPVCSNQLDLYIQ